MDILFQVGFLMKNYRPELEAFAKRAILHSFNTKKPIHESIVFVAKKSNLTDEDCSDMMDLIIEWEINSINEQHKQRRTL